MNDTAEAWIERLGLEPHPEGGWYRETYRSRASIGPCCLGGDFQGGRRAASTAIYYLLKAGEFSVLHRIRSDEVWHHYHGAGVLVHVIDRRGEYTTLRLGLDLDDGEQPQVVVPAASWFGATLRDPVGFALVGCTVAPGFDFREFEVGGRDDLLRKYPRHQRLIERLTRE